MRLVTTLLCLPLAACGLVDVGTSAAATAKMQADQAKQGKETMEKVQQSMDALAKQQEQQRADAEKKAGE